MHYCVQQDSQHNRMIFFQISQELNKLFLISNLSFNIFMIYGL